jgi:hypothetical protein
MFDHQQLHPLHTIRPTPPHLRPDLMRSEHVERLRRRDAEQRANLWQSAWQSVMQLAGAITEQLASLFNKDPRARARMVGIKRAG